MPACHVPCMQFHDVSFNFVQCEDIPSLNLRVVDRQADDSTESGKQHILAEACCTACPLKKANLRACAMRRACPDAPCDMRAMAALRPGRSVLFAPCKGLGLCDDSQVMAQAPACPSACFQTITFLAHQDWRLPGIRKMLQHAAAVTRASVHGQILFSETFVS